MESHIRAYIGTELDAEWTTSDDVLAPELQETIERVRDDFFELTGVEMPGVSLRPASYEATPVTSRQFRIEVLNQGPWHANAQPIETQPDSLVSFGGALSERAWVFRVHWLTPEYVQWLVDSPPSGTRDWLQSRYSLTDLKLLLRAVVGAQPEAPENTIRHTDWLLASLVFWHVFAEDPYDLNAIAGRLRETQLARLEPAISPAAHTEPVAAGISALLDGDAETAESFFKQAAKEAPRGAKGAFLASYPGEFQPQIRERLQQSCASLGEVSLTRPERLDLEALVEAPDPLLTEDERRRLKLCLFASYDPAERPRRRAELLQSLVSAAHEPNEWPPEDAAYFGRMLVQEYDPFGSDDSTLATAQALLESAFRRLDRERAADAYYQFLTICIGGGAKKRC